MDYKESYLMLEPSISEFFQTRKDAWLIKNIRKNMSDEEINQKQVDCQTIFSLEEWLPNASRRAWQMSMSTHPCTFSHPSSRKNINGYVTPIIAECEKKTDGFLRTGNANVETDALGNAAALDVLKFLSLIMSDGKKLLDHIVENSDISKELLDIKSMSYPELREGFLNISNNDDDIVTSSKIKQVFFPVNDGYHQLSLLTNSGLVYELRKRIDVLRFSEAVKELRSCKRENEFSENGYSEIYEITTMGYGGTKPQNISVLNSQNGGKAHLLSSLPPMLKQRSINFPKNSFFTDSFYKRDYADVFNALHKLFKTNYNNINIREGRNYRVQELIDRIVDKMWAIRASTESQFYDSSQLKAHQRVWLDKNYIDERESSDEWLDKLTQEISAWTIRMYEKTLGKQAIKLGEAERKKILEIVESNKEALR